MRGIYTMSNIITERNVNNYLHKVVKIEELSNIYDLWMILIRPIGSNLSEDEGILSFVGENTNSDSYMLYNEGNVVIPIFHDSMELESEIYDEE